MLAVLRQRNYALLWWGQLISMLGNWILIAALPFFVFELTGSVLATGAVFIANVVPQLLFGSVAGVFVDRWDRRRTMIVANLLNAVILVLLLGARSAGSLWLVYAVALLEATVNVFYGPANNALLPRLVGKEQLLAANSLDAFGENSARLVGPAMGGVLLGAAGLGSVVILDAVSYAVAGVLLLFIVVPASQEEAAAEPAHVNARAWLKVWREWLAGLRLVRGRPALVNMFIVFAIALLADSLLTVMLVPFVEKVVGVGAAEFGWVLSLRGLGGIAGGLLVGRYGKRFQPHHLVGYGLAAGGLVLLAMVQLPLLPVLALAALLVGIPTMAWLISGQTWLQSHSPDEYRGRVFGAFATTAALTSLLGMAFGSVAGESLGISTIIVLSGLLQISAGLVALLLLGQRSLQPSATPQE